MEQHYLDLIAKNSDNDPEIKKLYEAHLDFGKQIDKLEAKPYLTPSEETEVKELKKRKLAGKTKLILLLDKIAQ